MAKKPLEIDACAGSQLRDTQGEMLSVEGADISELEAGKGRWNDNHGKGFFNSVGRITHAKKIFKEEECEDDRQKYYWNKVKAPYIYVKGYLYDDEDHPNAKAAAAILRNVHKADCPLKLKASVEGGVVSRGISDPSLLARTKIHSVALTFTPANVATLVEPLSLDKSHIDEATDMELIRSVIHLAKTDVPSFRHIARDASASKIASNIEKITNLIRGNKEVDIPTKQEILQYALEAKIQKNVSSIHEIVKENLDKALPKKNASSYNVGRGFTGKDAVKAQANVLKDIKKYVPHKAYKTMPNEETGKPELHVMLHRGVANLNPKANKQNQFKVTDTHLHMPTDSVHTYVNDAAEQYMTPEQLSPAQMKLNQKRGAWEKANPDYTFEEGQKWRKQINDLEEKQIADGHKAGHTGVLSFWTPMSKLHGLGHDINPDDMHSMEQGHVAIKPGKFRRVTREEMQHMHDNSKPVKLNDDSSPKQLMHDQHRHLFPKESIKKALTAGYGGAGVPTANTGGGVLQSEALDDGRGSKDKSFKYVTCGDCGKEQIYSKYQVKCRDCGKSFPMEKLHKLFLG